jgi:2-polyprenyl-6-methoxyphenol hydroxylase-like FAD-dependent oxidoreductase
MLARRLFMSAALALAASTTAFAQNTTEEQLDPRYRARAEAMWKKMANADGMIMQKQFMDMVTEQWKKMDKANKGMITSADAARIMLFLSGQGAAP